MDSNFNNKLSTAMLTTYNQLPIEREKKNQTQIYFQNSKESRGISVGNKKEFVLKRHHNEINPKDPRFKHHNFKVPLNQNDTLKENEMLKLRIAELLKENKELKEQNLAYYQILNKEDFHIDQSKSNIQKKCTFKLNKKTMKELFNDEVQLHSDGKTLSNTILSVPNSTISHLTSNHSQSQNRSENSKLNLKSLNQKLKIMNIHLIKGLKEKQSNNNVHNSYMSNLTTLRKRTEIILNRYNSYVQNI